MKTEGSEDEQQPRLKGIQSAYWTTLH